MMKTKWKWSSNEKQAIKCLGDFLFVKAVVYHKNSIVGAHFTESCKKENDTFLDYS